MWYWLYYRHPSWSCHNWPLSFKIYSRCFSFMWLPLWIVCCGWYNHASREWKAIVGCFYPLSCCTVSCLVCVKYRFCCHGLVGPVPFFFSQCLASVLVGSWSLLFFSLSGTLWHEMISLVDIFWCKLFALQNLFALQILLPCTFLCVLSSGIMVGCFLCWIGFADDRLLCAVLTPTGGLGTIGICRKHWLPIV